eukprot:m.55770 g.55770  ORF g.55770 m.55770 type:complete len:50 (+) comp22128_c0_seq2:74-223(+)
MVTVMATVMVLLVLMVIDDVDFVVDSDARTKKQRIPEGADVEFTGTTRF